MSCEQGWIDELWSVDPDADKLWVLLVGKRLYYILHYDSQGFVTLEEDGEASLSSSAWDAKVEQLVNVYTCAWGVEMRVKVSALTDDHALHAVLDLIGESEIPMEIVSSEVWSA